MNVKTTQKTNLSVAITIALLTTSGATLAAASHNGDIKTFKDADMDIFENYKRLEIHESMIDTNDMFRQNAVKEIEDNGIASDNNAVLIKANNDMAVANAIKAEDNKKGRFANNEATRNLFARDTETNAKLDVTEARSVANQANIVSTVEKTADNTANIATNTASLVTNTANINSNTLNIGSTFGRTMDNQANINNNLNRINNANSNIVTNSNIIENVRQTSVNNSNRINGNSNVIDTVYSRTVINENEINAIETQISTTGQYLGLDNEVQGLDTLKKHTVQKNIHLGAGAQVGDNLNPDDDGYDEANIKTGMTALGAFSRADGDKSTALGSDAKSYGENSVAIGQGSIAHDDNTVSFGNDYREEVIGVEAKDAVEYQEGVPDTKDVNGVVIPGTAEILAQDAVIAVEAVEGMEENHRRLTHIAAGINNNDAVNMNQLNTLSSTMSGRMDGIDKRITGVEKSAMAGVAISMATKVILPDQGKKFRITVGMASFEGTSAIGINGAGRINDSTAVYFGLGTDSDGEYTAVQTGASYQW